MANINFEFRKGIFFIRFIGEINQMNKLEQDELREIIKSNKFKYIVLNMNYLRKIDLTGINYLYEICNLTNETMSNLVLCDKKNIIKRLFHNEYPVISSEIEVL